MHPKYIRENKNQLEPEQVDGETRGREVWLKNQIKDQRNISFKITEMHVTYSETYVEKNQLEQLLEEGSENLVDGGHGGT